MHAKRFAKQADDFFRRLREFGGLMKALGRKSEVYVWCTGPGTMAPRSSEGLEVHSTEPPLSQKLIAEIAHRHCAGGLSPQKLGGLIRRYRRACLEEGRPQGKTDEQARIIRERYSRRRGKTD